MLMFGNKQLAVQMMSLKTRTFIPNDDGSYSEELGDETIFSLQEIQEIKNSGIEVSVLDLNEKDVTDLILESGIGTGNEKT